MGEMSNIKLSDFRKFLKKTGCACERINGGHEIWIKEGLTRPIIVQTHKDPVPAFILKNALRALGISTKEFLNIVRTP